MNNLWNYNFQYKTVLKARTNIYYWYNLDGNLIKKKETDPGSISILQNKACKSVCVL